MVAIQLRIVGEVSEWLKEHAWKACVGSPYRGFESRPLRSAVWQELDQKGVAANKMGP